MPHDPISTLEYSVVVPCYNEEKNLPLFHQRLTAVMQNAGKTWEVIYINDGSTDKTLEVISKLAKENNNVSYIKLSRNFGKEVALTAGLDHARAIKAAIIIDADLQDPPEVIIDLINASTDVDTVYAQRKSRKTDGWLKRLTAYLFYRVMMKLNGRISIPPDTGDFRIISRRVIDALLTLRERHRFMKGLFAWVGFPSKAVLYDRDSRYSGVSSFNYWKLWNFALEGITSFTTLPLRFSTYIGASIGTFAMLYGVILTVKHLIFKDTPPFSKIIIDLILLIGGIQLMVMGVIGEYLGRIFIETKNRPLYIIEEIYVPEKNKDH